MDGQDISMTENVVLPNLLGLTSDSLPAVDAVLAKVKVAVADLVTENGRISGALIEQHQTAAHGLAWLATYAQSLHQMQGWGRWTRLGLRRV